MTSLINNFISSQSPIHCTTLLAYIILWGEKMKKLKEDTICFPLWSLIHKIVTQLPSKATHVTVLGVWNTCSPPTHSVVLPAGPYFTTGNSSDVGAIRRNHKMQWRVQAPDSQKYRYVWCEVSLCSFAYQPKEKFANRCQDREDKWTSSAEALVDWKTLMLLSEM